MITSFKKVAKYQLYNVSVARSKAPYIILSSNLNELGIVQAMKITDNPNGLPIMMEGGKVRYIYPDRYYTFFKKTFETLYPFGYIEDDILPNEDLGALLRDMFLEMNNLPMIHSYDYALRKMTYWNKFSNKYRSLLLQDKVFENRLPEVTKECNAYMAIHHGPNYSPFQKQQTFAGYFPAQTLDPQPTFNSYNQQLDESDEEIFTADDLDECDNECIETVVVKEVIEDRFNNGLEENEYEWDDPEDCNIEEVKRIRGIAEFKNFEDLHEHVTEESTPKRADLYINPKGCEKEAKERDKQEGACNFLTSALVKDPEVCEIAFEDLYKYYKYNYCHTFHHLVMDQNSFKKLIIRTFGVKIRTEKAIEGVKGRKQLIRGVKASPDFEHIFTRYSTENKVEISEEAIEKFEKLMGDDTLTEDVEPQKEESERLFPKRVKDWSDDQLKYWLCCFNTGNEQEIKDLMEITGVTNEDYLRHQKYHVIRKESEARGLRS